MVKGLVHKSFGKCLGEVGIIQPGRKEGRGDVIALYSYLKGGFRQVRDQSLLPSSKKRQEENASGVVGLDWMLRKSSSPRGCHAFEQAAQSQAESPSFRGI